MRLAIKFSAVLIACFIFSGCATMRYPGAYKVEGEEFKEFKELNDEKALKVIALIYNVRCETWEDGIARSLALEEYLVLMRARKSLYVKRSGIFNIKYDKAKLSSWKEDDLIKLYDYLDGKTNIYYMDSAKDLTEIENSRRITYLTAMGSIAREMKKRDNTKTAVSVVGQILVTALSVAVSMI